MAALPAPSAQIITATNEATLKLVLYWITYCQICFSNNLFYKFTFIKSVIDAPFKMKKALDI